MPDNIMLTATEFFHGPLHQLFNVGGPVMVVLVGIALAGTVTFIYLILSGALFAPRLTRHLRKTLAVWQQIPARVRPAQLRQQSGRYARLNPLLHLVANTIESCQKQEDNNKIRETVARDAQQALEPFEAPLKIIEVIAALAPLLGLLGTVMGMMEAFSAMSATVGRANAAQLSGGIYEALTTTAAGLIIAIPFAALAAWIEFRLRRIRQVIDSTLVTILNVSGPAISGQESMKVITSPLEPVYKETRESTEISGTDNRHFAHAAG
jgi:biopolymer transport protein ExbB